MAKCPKCGEVLRWEGKEGPVASISGSIMGDECTDTYYFCSRCQAYTKEGLRDSFTTGEHEHEPVMIPKAKGDRIVANIRRCGEPWNKKCRCDAHKEHFGGWLD